MGTPRINTDRDGNVVSRSDYVPYGEEIVALGGRSSTDKYVVDDVRQGFTGYINDGETGLDCAQARMYAKGLGRFTGVDFGSFNPVDPQNLNRYTYVQNNPMKFIDPTGNTLTILGDDADNLIGELEKYSGYKLKRNKKTGIVTIVKGPRTEKGTSKSLAEKLSAIVKDAKNNAKIETVRPADESKDDTYVDKVSTDKKGHIVNVLDMNDFDIIKKDSSDFTGATLGHILSESYDLSKFGNGNTLEGAQDKAVSAHDKALEFEGMVLSDLKGTSEKFMSERQVKPDVYRFTFTSVAYDIQSKTTNPNILVKVTTINRDPNQVIIKKP